MLIESRFRLEKRKFQRETFDNLAAPSTKQVTRDQANITNHISRNFSQTQTAGWGRSADRARLSTNFPANRDFSGKLGILRLKRRVPETEVAALQALLSYFPKNVSGNFLEVSRGYCRTHENQLH
jgi:hypothetical protein